MKNRLIPVLFLVALLIIQCQNESKNNTVQGVALPVIVSITKDGGIQTADGTTRAIPHYGEQGWMVLFAVRHCESDHAISNNPPLTAEGRARAERLGRVLDNAVIDKLAGLNTKRTVETAQSVRRWAGDPVMENFPFEAQNDWLAENLDQGSGKRIFYIGHFNSVPSLLNHLTASIKYKNISELDFDRFFVVVTQGIGKTEVLEYRY